MLIYLNISYIIERLYNKIKINIKDWIKYKNVGPNLFFHRPDVTRNLNPKKKTLKSIGF